MHKHLKQVQGQDYRYLLNNMRVCVFYSWRKLGDCAANMLKLPQLQFQGESAQFDEINILINAVVQITPNKQQMIEYSNYTNNFMEAKVNIITEWKLESMNQVQILNQSVTFTCTWKRHEPDSTSPKNVKVEV